MSISYGTSKNLKPEMSNRDLRPFAHVCFTTHIQSFALSSQFLQKVALEKSYIWVVSCQFDVDCTKYHRWPVCCLPSKQNRGFLDISQQKIENHILTGVFTTRKLQGFPH